MSDTTFATRLTAARVEANFADAHPALTPAQAVAEADRCYFCYDAPCTAACPTEIDVPGFIRGIATGNIAGAARKIFEQNIFGGSCARVCPTEILCEQACVRMAQEGEPIDIGALQRVATDWQMAQGAQLFARAPATGRHVAVVGAGPAGLACAHALALRGHEVRVYEAKAKPGGLNEYGIAAYKMADEFAAREVEFVTSIGGIEIEYNRRLADDLSLDVLRERFDAVFLALGLGSAKRLMLAQEDLPAVRDAIDFIAELRQAADKSAVRIGRRVVVIGGGNTAIDAATQAKLLGADEVTILYRRGPEQMSATAAEQDWTRRHGVNVRYWADPLTITKTGVLAGNGEIGADLILTAIGQQLCNIECMVENGRIKVDASYQTSWPGVFAGGDCTAGVDLTVHAVQDGKLAARAMDEFLSQRHG